MGQVNHVTNTKIFERILMGFWWIFWKTSRFERFRNLIFDFSLSAMIDWAFVYTSTQPALFNDLPLKNASLPRESPKTAFLVIFGSFSQFFAPPPHPGSI